MKWIIILLIITFLISCSSLKKLYKNQLLTKEQFNFENSTALAAHQTELLTKYKNKDSIPENEIKQLENNLWVKSAVKLAPGNLVIRQWCLIDLLRNKPAHARDIHRLIGCLSYDKQIHSEGYSYFLYTREILDVWVDVFPNAITTNNIREILSMVDMGFMRTAYKRGSVFYPAPFGDVRDHSLNDRLQLECLNMDHVSCQVGPVTLTINGSDTVYIVKGTPIGMNTHIPKNNYTVKIINGIPSGYTFYNGYENKYKNREEEIRDLVDPKRLNAIQSVKDCD